MIWTKIEIEQGKDKERTFLFAIYFISGQRILYYKAKWLLALNAKATKLLTKSNFSSLSVFVLQLHTKFTIFYRFLTKVLSFSASQGGVFFTCFYDEISCYERKPRVLMLRKISGRFVYLINASSDNSMLESRQSIIYKK